MAQNVVPGSNVFFRFFRTGQTVRRLMLAVLEESGLSPDEYGVLSSVRALGIVNGGPGAVGPVQPTEMAQWIGMPPTTVSTYIARFLDRGLVERRPNPDDRRSYFLALTTEGDAVVDAAARRMTAMIEEVAGESDVDLNDVAEALVMLDAAGRRVLDSEPVSR